MGGVVANQVVERLSVRVHLSCLDRLTELRLVASDCFQLFLERIADVDNERWLLMVLTKRESVNDFERTMRRCFRLDLFQASDEAGVPHQLGNYRMIRVPPVQRMRDHDFWLK